MKQVGLFAGMILIAASANALSQTSAPPSSETAATNGQATSSTRTTHSRHHKASSKSDAAPTSEAKAVRPPGSGPTSGR